MLTMQMLYGALVKNIKDDIPSIVLGPPGVGKSDIFKQIAADLKIGYKDIRLTQMDPVDLRGLPVTKGTKTSWLPPSFLPQVERDGKAGLIVFEELPDANDSMQKAAYSGILDRFIGEYTFPKLWIPQATGNRIMDRTGSRRMGTALRSRFAQFEVEADLDSWLAWAATNGQHPLVMAFLRHRPVYLHKMPENDENAFPNPRGWERVSKVIQSSKDEPAIRKERVAAIVGEPAALEVEAFVQVVARLPNLDEAFRDPKTVHVPGLDEPGLLFALVSAAARRVKKQQMENAVIYIKRIGSPEFLVMFMLDAVRRDPSLKETKAFSKWYVDHQDVLI
jgi:hypothetical protein